MSGSLNERSVAQLHRAEIRGVPTFAVDPAMIGLQGWRGTATSTIATQLRERGVMVVHTSASRAASPSLAGALLHALGTLVKGVVDASGVPTIALFGGDTAFAVVEALGIRVLEPLGEICQGVVVSGTHRTRGAAAPGDRTSAGVQHLVTKAGGFGPVDVIDRIEGALAREG